MAPVLRNVWEVALLSNEGPALKHWAKALCWACETRTDAVIISETTPPDPEVAETLTQMLVNLAGRKGALATSGSLEARVVSCQK